MDAKGLRDPAVASLVGVQASTVWRLRHGGLPGGRFPSQRMIARFVKATNGAVMPNDWLPEILREVNGREAAE